MLIVLALKEREKRQGYVRTRGELIESARLGGDDLAKLESLSITAWDILRKTFGVVARGTSGGSRHHVLFPATAANSVH